MAQARCPSLFQINTRVWLTEICRALRRPATPDDVPDAALDCLASPLPYLLYAILSLTVVRMMPVAIAVLGTRVSAATVLFMGWFGPRGLASIVLGLVFLGEETHVPGEETIKLAVMVTVMLSIFAHGFSALPGITLYTRKVATLAATAPETKP